MINNNIQGIYEVIDQWQQMVDGQVSQKDEISKLMLLDFE